MAKTRFKTSRFGDTYDSRYYTQWNGLVVSKRALRDSQKSGKATDSLISSISSKNKIAFSEREDGKVSGLADPKKFLTALREESSKTKHKGMDKLDKFKSSVKTLTQSDVMTTEEQRVGANFGKMMNQAMSQAEKNDLRKFIGWKEGYNFRRAGFTWNATEKRFEKQFTVGGVTMTKYIYINNQYIRTRNGIRTYGAGALEYGVE